MRNVLVIVYYFPPMGGSGVQRPLKFIKYLRRYGWNPVVLCPEPGAYHSFDESLREELDSMNIEVHRIPVSTPFHKLNRGRSEKTLNTSDRLAKILRRISRLFYYPDNKRAWIKPAVQKGIELINERNIDLIFTSAPPYSNLMIGSELKKLTHKPVIYDYRDSWLQNHFLKGLFGWQKTIMKRMEAECLMNADLIIGLDQHMLRSISEDHEELEIKTRVIPHGYDPEDFENKKIPMMKYQEGKLNILYSGLFYESNQPDNFLKAVSDLIKEDNSVQDKVVLHFQGGLEKRHVNLISSLGLGKITFDYGYVSHREAVVNVRKADLLWMVSNFDPEFRQIKSGKLFEYMGSRNPVLGMVHSGEEQKLLEQYGPGFTCRPDDPGDIRQRLSEIILRWENSTLGNASEEFVQKYDRKRLSGELASIFNEIAQ